MNLALARWEVPLEVSSHVPPAGAKTASSRVDSWMNVVAAKVSAHSGCQVDRAIHSIEHHVKVLVSRWGNKDWGDALDCSMAGRE